MGLKLDDIVSLGDCVPAQNTIAGVDGDHLVFLVVGFVLAVLGVDDDATILANNLVGVEEALSEEALAHRQIGLFDF